MKRLFYLLAVVFGMFIFVGFKPDLENFEMKSKEVYLNCGGTYNGEIYIARRPFEDKESVKDLNQLLYAIINSQEAIITLMDGYSVKDVVFIDDDVKDAINAYYEIMVTALDDLQYGVGNERFSIIKDEVASLYNDAIKLEVDYNSRDSKDKFYGNICYQYGKMKELVELYRE